MRQINEIILHCTATKEGREYTLETIRGWHVNERGFSDVGYGYIIHLDGSVDIGRPIERQGAHCTGHNKNSIGICYVGGLDSKGNPKDTRTQEQKKSLYKLINELLQRFNLTVNDVYTHNYFTNKKQCPCFTTEQIRKELNELNCD